VDADHSIGDLQVENAVQPNVEPVGPKVRPSFSFDELRRDPHAAARFAAATL